GIALAGARRLVDQVTLLPRGVAGLVLPLPPRLTPLVARGRLRKGRVGGSRQRAFDPCQQRHLGGSFRLARTPGDEITAKYGTSPATVDRWQPRRIGRPDSRYLLLRDTDAGFLAMSVALKQRVESADQPQPVPTPPAWGW